MKKLLIVAAAATALSSSIAFADGEDMFFVKANVGANIMNKSTDKLAQVKMKSDTNVHFGVGVGYYVMDNVRADLMLDHYANPTLKKTGTKHKGNLDTLMLNAYVDLFDVSVAKVFVGGGVGMARLGEKITYPASVAAAGASSGKKNNLAYALTAGLSAEVGTGVNAELSYSWKDFSKTKGKTALANGVNTGKELSKTSYKGHHFTVGFRFDI